MKCIKKKSNGKISRVSDNMATVLTEAGEYEYTSKSEWKKSKK